MEHSKKLTLATFSLTACLSAYAALPTGALPFQAIVPNLKSGIAFTMEGLYVQPSNADMNYLSTTITPSSGSSTLSQKNVSSVTPDYNFGFRIGMGYVFPNSGNDVQAAWTHFNHNDTNNASVTATNSQFSTTVMTQGRQFFDLATGDTFNASSTANFDYDAVDLNVGQYLSVGTRLTMRLFSGLRFARTSNDINDYYLELAPASSSTDTLSESYHSKFSGIGPRFGIDTAYQVAKCFGVVGHISAALLIGQVDASTNISNTFTDTSGAFLSNVQLGSENITRVVPTFDAKVGANYTVPFHNDAQNVTVEAGYQWTQYIDAIDRLYNIANSCPILASPNGANNACISSPGVITNRNYNRVTSNFGFGGPYLSVNLKI